MNLDDIRNYYEPLVQTYLVEQAASDHGIDDADLLEDIACIALNILPAHYIRHEVDMAFFLTTAEREEMRTNVINAVEQAIRSIENRQSR